MVPCLAAAEMEVHLEVTYLEASYLEEAYQEGRADGLRTASVYDSGELR